MLNHAYAQFGFELLKELHSSCPEQNIFISPMSIAVALAMTANGASGTTREAILQVLHSDAQPIGAFNVDNHTLVQDVLIQQITGMKNIQLLMSNVLWFEPGTPISSFFAQTLATTYSAQCESLDFRSPSAAQTINARIAAQTQGQIKKIVSHIAPSTIAMLTNAMFFKGRWTLPFDPVNTRPSEFRLVSGSSCEVQMMNNTNEYAYSSAKGIELIRATYADGRFAAYIALPQEAGGLHSFLRDLTEDAFATLASSLKRQRGTLELPRLSISYNTTLNSALAKLGMRIAFGPHATFEGICAGHSAIQLSAMQHASCLLIDEEGTEAAAATSIGFRTRVMTLEPRPFHMIVNHPFFIAIRDEQSGHLVFAGAIFAPTIEVS